MTRVVVQRGQGAPNSVQSRTSTNSSASAAPTPPPLPPHLPVSLVPFTPTLYRTSSSPPSVVSEEEHNESKDVDTLSCGEPSCSDANSSEVGKKAEDEECFGHPASFDKDGRQLYSKSRHSIASLNEGEEGCSTVQQHDDADAVNCGSLTSLGGGIGPSGLEGEPLKKRDEDIGSQKTSVDFQQEGIIEKGDECPLQVVHSKIDDIPFSEPPSQSSGACGLSAPLSAVEVGPATSPSVSSSMPTPSAVSIPPASRRGGWSGSSFSGGLRTVASSRRNPRSIRSSRSPPQNSRSSSPRSYAEGDGYNSADEQSPWAVGQTMYEDNDDRERQFEIEIRRSRGLEVRRMAEDGNCLFRAVADQVYGDPEMHSETRQMCIDYMEKERDHFSQFVTESFSAYCKRKRRDKVYGNNLEIQAMAEMYNRPIHIFCYSIEPKNIFQGSYQTDLPPIRLSYHRDNHYNSLVDPNRPTVGAGLGFGSLHGANIDRDQVKAAIKAQQDSQIDKALLAEGRYYSDLELTEQEMERMVIEASRAEFLAEEYGQQIGCIESSTSAAGTSYSHGDVPDRLLSDRQGNSTTSICAPSPASTALTSNMRTLLSMGFSYFRVVEACSIFGDDINDMLCYLLEAETGGLFEESLYRMKGKAAER